MVPDRRVSLFTVLAVVLAVGIAVTMYWPYRVGLQIARNETIALRALAEIQTFIRKPDEPGPSWRYQFLQELQADGTVGARLAERLGTTFSGDDLRVSGYRIRVYLPDREGQGVSYSRVGRVSAKRAALTFACYAWPSDYGRTGRRAFVLDAHGEIHSTENQHRRYDGERHGPLPGAAFAVDDVERLATGPRREVTDGRHWGADGQLWRLSEVKATPDRSSTPERVASR